MAGKRKTPQEKRAGPERPRKRRQAATPPAPAPTRMTRSRLRAIQTDESQNTEEVQLNPGLSMEPRRRGRKEPVARTTPTPQKKAAPKKKATRKEKGVAQEVANLEQDVAPEEEAKEVTPGRKSTRTKTTPAATPPAQPQRGTKVDASPAAPVVSMDDVVENCPTAPIVSTGCASEADNPVAPVAYMGGIGEQDLPMPPIQTMQPEALPSAADTAGPVYRYVYPWQGAQAYDGIPKLVDVLLPADGYYIVAEQLPVSFPTPPLAGAFADLDHRVLDPSTSTATALQSKFSSFSWPTQGVDDGEGIQDQYVRIPASSGVLLLSPLISPRTQAPQAMRYESRSQTALSFCENAASIPSPPRLCSSLEQSESITNSLVVEPSPREPSPTDMNNDPTGENTIEPIEDETISDGITGVVEYAYYPDGSQYEIISNEVSDQQKNAASIATAALSLLATNESDLPGEGNAIDDTMSIDEMKQACDGKEVSVEQPRTEVVGGPNGELRLVEFPPWPYGPLSPVADDDHSEIELNREDCLSY